MKSRKEAARIVKILEDEYPVAKCGLEAENAWQLLVSVRLSAQCTDRRVNAVTPVLFSHFPSAESLAYGDIDKIKEIIRSCGLGNSKARDIKRCMKEIVEKYGGTVPRDMDKLLRLPGVGRKSANLILGDVYGLPAVVADTHCIRISNRLGFMNLNDKNSTDPYKVEMALKKMIAPEKQNDLCHRFVLHGRKICTARKPKCQECVLSEFCRYKKNLDKKHSKHQ
jgi:endonuclease-3